MSDKHEGAATFDAQYRSLAKDVFREIARNALARGGDAREQAQHYAEHGKPDFALAYLLASMLPDSEKRELFALSYERRADYIEERAREFDRKFHRPFPLLFTEASKDRTAAKQIRAGQTLRPAAQRDLPLL